MAQSVTFPTAASTFANLRKITWAKMYPGFKTSTEEFDWFSDMPKSQVGISARQMTFPVDLEAAHSPAMIPESGYEARTDTPTLREATVAPVQMNVRFNLSLLARYYSQKERDAEIVKQVVHQTLKNLESMKRAVGRQTYGFTTGIVADTSTNATATSGTAYTLEDAYGVASLDNANYLGSFFIVGEGVGLIRAAALVANGIGEVTARSLTTPSATVTWAGSVDCDADDSFVYANAVTDTTITATDYGRWPVGFLDACTSTSVHGLSGATYPNWTAGYANTTAGRFTFIQLQKMKQGLYNKGGRTLTDIIWSNGVLNDVTEGERVARIYNDGEGMDLDGSVKAKGIRFHTSALVPPGAVFGWDKECYQKLIVEDGQFDESPDSFDSMDKVQDRNALTASRDFVYARVVRSRAGIGYALNQTEQ